MPEYITKINQSGTEYNIKDAVSGYITDADLPNITVNTNTKTLVIVQTVNNADDENF